MPSIYYKIRTCLTDLCSSRVYCTGGKLKQISQGERNTNVRLTVTNRLDKHINTPPSPHGCLTSVRATTSAI